MKKFFTFVFCALCAVSVWGTEVNVTISGSGTTTTPDFPFCITRGFPIVKVYQSKTQQIYLASEIGSTNAGTIKSISFKSSNYSASSSVVSDTRRNLTVYMQETDLTSLSSFVDITSATQVFSFDAFEITSGKEFTFGNFKFKWGGTKNILITIIDQSNNYTASQTKTFVGYEPSTKNRGIAQTFEVSDCPGPYIEPTVLNTIAQITFTIEASGSTTPSISTSTDALNFGSYYPEGEIVSQTFTVTASNLTENISLSTEAAGVTISPESIDYTNTALANDGVEVTVTLGAEYTFTSGAKLSITSDGASPKEIALSATEVRDEDFSKPSAYSFFTYDATKEKNGYVYYTETLTIQNVANSQFKPYSTAAFMVDYSNIDIACESGGKVANLRGKFISEEVFKAFSFDYTAPEETGSIIIDENEDNSGDWPESTTEQNKSLIIKRTVVPDCWNTICLPTYLTSTQVTDIFGTGADVRSFTGANITSSSITLNFSEDPKTDGIEAGVPYLIKPTKAMDNPLNLTNQSFNPTPGSVEKNGIVFQGVLVPTVVGEGGDEYIIVGANNTLLHPTESGTINGMRAYFHVVGTAAKAALKTAKVSMNTGSTTELVLIKDNQTKPYKTMVNDQIVIVKEGQKVNIFGQTVK